jgi:hypothetical protein
MIWMQHKHIPEILATGKFTAARMVRVLIEEERRDVFLFNTQQIAKKLWSDTIKRMHRVFEEGLKLFGDKMLAFRTELELIADYK